MENNIESKAKDISIFDRFTARLLSPLTSSAAIIIVISIAFIVFGGGIPATADSDKDISITFKVPPLGWSYIDRDRGYMQVSYDKSHWRADRGVLKYEFTTSSTHPVGIKTEAFSVERKQVFSFWMKALTPCTVNIRLKEKEQEYDLEKQIEVESEWKKFTIKSKEFFPLNAKVNTTRNSFTSYLEISIGPDSFPTPNTLWIDSINLDNY